MTIKKAESGCRGRYGTEPYTLIDNGAIPFVTKSTMAGWISLISECTSTIINVDSGQKTTYRGALRAVSAKLGKSGAKLTFHVVEGPVQN